MFIIRFCHSCYSYTTLRFEATREGERGGGRAEHSPGIGDKAKSLLALLSAAAAAAAVIDEREVSERQG